MFVLYRKQPAVNISVLVKYFVIHNFHNLYVANVS